MEDVSCAVRAGTICRGLLVQFGQLGVALVGSEKQEAGPANNSGPQRKKPSSVGNRYHATASEV
jgi:hypothetical protein